MSDLTLDQLRAGIHLQCEILFEEDEFHGELIISRKDLDDDPIVSVSVTKDMLQRGNEEIMTRVQNGLCTWLDEQGFAEYAFVLGNASSDGSFVVKLDTDVPQV